MQFNAYIPPFSLFFDLWGQPHLRLSPLGEIRRRSSVDFCRMPLGAYVSEVLPFRQKISLNKVQVKFSALQKVKFAPVGQVMGILITATTFYEVKNFTWKICNRKNPADISRTAWKALSSGNTRPFS